MKNFMWMYTKGLFLLCLWVLTGVIGSVQRFNSPMFDKWLEQKDLGLIKQGYEPNVFDFLGYTPPLVFIFESIFALFCLAIFVLIYWLLTIKLSTTFKGFTRLIRACFTAFMGYTIYVAIKDLAVNIHWCFYILLAQDIIWLVFSLRIIQSFWKSTSLK